MMKTSVPASPIDRGCRPLQPSRATRTCGLTCCATCRTRSRLVCGALGSQDAVAISDVTEIPSQYKGILLDQFGVLHDGKHAYPDALGAVKKLAADGRRIVVLSNSSRRMGSSNTIPRIEKMGFERGWFWGAVTSGELTFRFLRDRPDGWWQGLGRKCLHLSWGPRGAVSLDGLDLQTVLEPEEADFVVAHGTEALGRGEGEEPVPAGLDKIDALLQRAAAKGIPLVVANPDVVTVSGDSLVPMPGTFARLFREMGGEVRLMGKPDPIIYEAAMEVMGLAANEVLAVGDSLEHDISGAAAAGIDSLFVAGGIHAEELGVSSAHPFVDQDRLTALCHEHIAHPGFVIPFLK